MMRIIQITFLLALATAAQAQTAPSASEIASYDGLFRAAHEGDIETILRLANAGADLDARDRAGRA